MKTTKEELKKVIEDLNLRNEGLRFKLKNFFTEVLQIESLNSL